MCMAVKEKLFVCMGLNVNEHRPIAKLSGRASILHENEAYCAKTKNSLYFYIAKSEF